MKPPFAPFPSLAARPIVLDGSMGEGGGQVLRTSLALSCLTGRPLELTRIRAGRNKPGLMRQHLTCVRAAARASGARVEGGELSSTEIRFEPAGLFPTVARFEIGTAGSTALVIQTILWPLLFAEGPSDIELIGGTDVLAAPSIAFLQQTFLPLLNAMGATAQLELLRSGYYPAGGGHVKLKVTPLGESARLIPIDLDAAPVPRAMSAQATTSRIPAEVARRELDQLAAKLAIRRENLHEHRDEASVGPGNVVHAHVPMDDGRRVILEAYGRRGRSAEKVAGGLAEAVRKFTSAKVSASEHLADQLLLPLALAGGGSFTTTEPSLHTRTNAEVITGVLGTSFEVDEIEPGRYRVSVSPSSN